jgi:transmembrane sensor
VFKRVAASSKKSFEIHGKKKGFPAPVFIQACFVMDYLLYEPEDFASDESYLRYYFKLNDADVAFWQNWVRNHPERLDIITNADHLIGFLALHLDETEFQLEYERIIQAISSEQHKVTGDSAIPLQKKRTIGSQRSSLRALLIAAAVIGAVVISAFFIFNGPTVDKKQPGNATTAFVSKGVNTTSNNTAKAIRYKLEDGTAITLAPGSSFSYPDHFLADKREVSLDGEAFFEVSRNVKRPFYVYYNNLVTHVLGTSFTIKTDKQKAQVEVSVSTGKVEVYEEREAVDKKLPHVKNNGVILTPNQKVVYREKSKEFESSLVDVPLPIHDHSGVGKDQPVDLDNIILKATPVEDILRSMEQVYGIEIEVENDNINHCHFAGDISDLNLYVKLDIICQSLNASYETKGTKILVRGKGCQ